MKKNLLWLAGTAVLVACAQTEIGPNASISSSKPQDIRFEVYQQGESRATETDISALQSNGFQLAIVDNAGDWYNEGAKASVVSYDGSEWNIEGTSAPKWPIDGSTLNFYAWNRISTDVSTVEDPAYSFEPSQTAPKLVFDDDNPLYPRYDLVVAKAVKKTFSEGRVSLSFQHALSQVHITLKDPDANYIYVVKKVSVEYERYVTYNFASGMWTSNDSSSPNTDVVDYYDCSDSYEQTPLGATNFVDGKKVTTSGVSFDSFFIVPDLAAKISIEYDVYDKTTYALLASYTSVQTGSSSIEFDPKEFSVTGLKSNTDVTLNVTLAPHDAPITVSVTAPSSWGGAAASPKVTPL